MPRTDGFHDDVVAGSPRLSAALLCLLLLAVSAISVMLAGAAGWWPALAGTVLLVGTVWILAAQSRPTATPTATARHQSWWSVACVVGFALSAIGNAWTSLFLLPVIALALTILPQRTAVLLIALVTTISALAAVVHLRSNTFQTTLFISIGSAVGVGTGLWMAQALASNIRRARAAGQVAERDRIRRDLHDNVLQHTSSGLQTLRHVRVLLRRGQGDEALHFLDAAIEAHEHASAQTRRLLLPPTEAPAGRPVPEVLGEALASGVDGSGLEITTDLRLSASALPAPVAAEVLALITEAVSNVRQHAQARRVVVTLEDGPAPDSLVILVDDDGTGPAFLGSPAGPDARSGGSGHGIANMRHRAASLNGTLAFDVSPLGGTQLRVTLHSCPADSLPVPLTRSASDE